MKFALNIRHCKLADDEHRRSKRQYAHVGHYKRTVCVADAFYELPREYRIGILVHEVGHLLGAIDEEEADVLGIRATGIPIVRVDSIYGKNLQKAVGI